MQMVKVDNSARIAVEDINPRGRRAVLFIHGWPLDRRIFEYQVNILPQSDIRCILVDLRGFGDSDKPWNGYTYDRMSDDLYKVICSLDVRSLTLCGFSMGGAIAIRYMTRHRGFKVSRLALLGAAAPCFTQRDNYPYGMTKEQVDGLILQTMNDRAQMAADFSKQLFASHVSAEIAGWFTRIAQGGCGWSTIKAALALRDEDLRPDLRRIQIPTAIYHGVLDQVCPFDFALQLNQGIDGSILYPFEHSGHALFYDEKEELTDSLTEFICW